MNNNSDFHFMSIYRLKNFSEQTVKIVNPPGIVCGKGDWANVSLRTSIFHNNALKIVDGGVGGVQAIVPKQSIAWKL
jgi:hypothetical protein